MRFVDRTETLIQQLREHIRLPIYGFALLGTWGISNVVMDRTITADGKYSGRYIQLLIPSLTFFIAATICGVFEILIRIRDKPDAGATSAVEDEIEAAAVPDLAHPLRWAELGHGPQSERVIGSATGPCLMNSDEALLRSQFDLAVSPTGDVVGQIVNGQILLCDANPSRAGLLRWIPVDLAPKYHGDLVAVRRVGDSDVRCVIACPDYWVELQVGLDGVNEHRWERGAVTAGAATTDGWWLAQATGEPPLVPPFYVQGTIIAVDFAWHAGTSLAAAITVDDGKWALATSAGPSIPLAPSSTRLAIVRRAHPFVVITGTERALTVHDVADAPQRQLDKAP